MDTTHGSIADLIGVTISSVSRLRSGHQKPSLDRMVIVRDKLGWSIEDQVTALTHGVWHVEFERRIRIWADAQASPGDTPETPGEVA